MEEVILTHREAVILESLREHKALREIAAMLGDSYYTIKTWATKLGKMGLLQSHPGTHQYTVFDHFTYVIKDEDEVKKLRRKRRDEVKTESLSGLAWDDEIKFYLKEHFKKGYTRGQMAKKLGIPRAQFSLWLTDMGITSVSRYERIGEEEIG